MSRTVYVASKPISELPLPRTRLLGTSVERQSYNSPNPHYYGTEHCVLEMSSGQPLPFRIIASRKRRRTVAARLRSGVLELLVPASMPHVEREHWAEVMTRRLQRKAERSRPSDERLDQRARNLNARHFGGRLRWKSVGFAEMDRLWGSCTFTEGHIRIARRAASLPDWVLDYLLMHELRHLGHRHHSPASHGLENLDPLTARATGYLLTQASSAWRQTCTAEPS